MSNRGTVCSALNCSNNRKKKPNISFFRFPKDTERSKKWVANSGRKDLESKDAEYLYKNIRFCANHFEDTQFMNSHKNKLVWSAIPTLFDIPNKPLFGIQNKPETFTHKTKLPITNNIDPINKNICINNCSSETELSITTNNIEPINKKICLDNTSSKTELPTTKNNIEPINKKICLDNNNSKIELLSITNNIEAVNKTICFDNSSSKTVLPFTNNVEPINKKLCVDIINSSLLLEKKKIEVERLNKIIKDLRDSNKRKNKIIRKLSVNQKKLKECSCGKVENKKKKVVLKKTVQLEKKVIESILSKYMTKEAVQLIINHIQIPVKNTVGNRWGNEIKLFALNILFCSPRAYKFLCKYFQLPTERTLQRFVESNDFECGNKDQMLMLFKENVNLISENITE